MLRYKDSWIHLSRKWIELACLPLILVSQGDGQGVDVDHLEVIFETLAVANRLVVLERVCLVEQIPCHELLSKYEMRLI